MSAPRTPRREPVARDITVSRAEAQAGARRLLRGQRPPRLQQGERTAKDAVWDHLLSERRSRR